MKSGSGTKHGGVYMRSAAGLRGRVDGSGTLIRSNLGGELKLFAERGFYRLESRWVTPSDVLVQGTRLSRGGPAKPHIFLCRYDPRDASTGKIVHTTPVSLPVAWQGTPSIKVLPWQHMQGAAIKRARGNLPDGMAALEDLFKQYKVPVYMAFHASDRATGVSSVWKAVLTFQDKKDAGWGKEYDIDVCQLKVNSVDGRTVSAVAGTEGESCLNPDFCPDRDWVVIERTVTVEVNNEEQKVSRIYLADLEGIVGGKGKRVRDIPITSIVTEPRLGETAVNYCFPKWCPAPASTYGSYHNVLFKKIYRNPDTGVVERNLAVIKVPE